MPPVSVREIVVLPPPQWKHCGEMDCAFSGPSGPPALTNESQTTGPLVVQLTVYVSDSFVLPVLATTNP
ncbi:MAG TPA: hypothetical protein VFI39_05185 [Gemmatimonadales bacterium]|nr:hypothetical protein [Gemmatimonadales bacterium]